MERCEEPELVVEPKSLVDDLDLVTCCLQVMKKSKRDGTVGDLQGVIYLEDKQHEFTREDLYL